MTTQYRYPTELVHDAFWEGKPQPHTASGRIIRFTVKNTDHLPCAVCGRQDFSVGYNTYETTPGTSRMGSVLSSNFGEHFALAQPHSPVTCPYCESVVRDNFRTLNGIVANPAKVWMIVGKGKQDVSDTRIKASSRATFTSSCLTLHSLHSSLPSIKTVLVKTVRISFTLPPSTMTANGILSLTTTRGLLWIGPFCGRYGRG